MTFSAGRGMNRGRRSFLWALLLGFASLFLPSCAKAKRSSRRVSLGPIDKFQATLTPLPVYRLLVTKDDLGFAAMSLQCTHMSCLLKVDSQGIHCPCHGARFSKAGKVLKGPAEKPLSFYKLAIEDDQELVVYLDETVSPDWRLS